MKHYYLQPRVYRRNGHIFKHWTSQSLLCAQHTSICAPLVARHTDDIQFFARYW